MRDLAIDADLLARGVPLRLGRAARSEPPRRRVLAIGIERDDAPNVMAHARRELMRSRHGVEIQTKPVEGKGRWENVNELLAANRVEEFDWLVIVDDDVILPEGFLDRFLFLVERFGLRIAQPAHRRRSHTAWEVTRRRHGSVVRETQFVEQGPLVAFDAGALGELMPFPALRSGWGLDLHWSALARERGWRIGVVDALPVRHGMRTVGSTYSATEAAEEGRRFLASRPYLKAEEAQRTLAVHRRW
ncbi:MAG: hypothetical protein NVSMB25_00790 [Thermoleophilaceae bacterium]